MDRTTKRIICYLAGVMLIIGLIWLADYQEWKQKMDDMEPTWSKSDIIGTWVHNADILGARQVVEVFNADGTWQIGKEEGIVRKGNWSYIGNEQIEIQETWVAVGETQGRSDGKRILTIVYLHDDEIAFKDGEFFFTYKRMNVDGE